MALNMFFFVLASSCVTFAALIEKCPPKESITCFCSSSYYPFKGIDIVCTRIGSQKTTLQDNLKALRGYSIQSLNLEKVNASMMSADLFQGLHVKKLELFLFEVDDASFRPEGSHLLGLENSLQELRISYSFLRNKPFLNLKLDNFNSLKEVSINGNQIPEIGNDWFTNGPTNLEKLTANGNGIEKLGDKAFASLKNLRSLSLKNNNVTEISRSMLPFPAVHLTSLNLGENKIRTLPNDIFSSMPALNIVHLNSNLIHYMPEDIWSSVLPRLYYVEFDANPLQCDQDLKWICKQDTYIVITRCASPVDKKGHSLQEFCRS